MPFRPWTSLDVLRSSGGKSLHDIGWERDGFAGGQDTGEALVQFGWRRLTEDRHMPDCTQLQAIRGQVVGRAGEERLLHAPVGATSSSLAGEAGRPRVGDRLVL